MAIENPAAAPVANASDNVPAPPTNLPDDQKPEGNGSSAPEKIRITPPEGGFKEIPKEFDPNKHKPLRKKDFEDPRTWHRMKIADLNDEIKKHNDQIALFDQFGTDPDAIKQARVVNKAATVLRDLIQQKKQAGGEAGYDVEAMLASLGLRIGTVEETTPAETPQG